MKPTYSLLLALFIVTSCNQANKNKIDLSPNETSTTKVPASFYVLKKTNESQACGCDHEPAKNFVTAVPNCAKVKDVVSACEPEAICGNRLQAKK